MSERRSAVSLEMDFEMRLLKSRSVAFNGQETILPLPKVESKQNISDQWTPFHETINAFPLLNALSVSGKFAREQILTPITRPTNPKKQADFSEDIEELKINADTIPNNIAWESPSSLNHHFLSRLQKPILDSNSTSKYREYFSNDERNPQGVWVNVIEDECFEHKNEDDDGDMVLNKHVLKNDRDWIVTRERFFQECKMISGLKSFRVSVILDLESCFGCVKYIPSHVNCFAFGGPLALQSLMKQGITSLNSRTRLCISQVEYNLGVHLPMSFFCGSLTSEWRNKGVLVVVVSENIQFRRDLLRLFSQWKILGAGFGQDDYLPLNIFLGNLVVQDHSHA